MSETARTGVVEREVVVEAPPELVYRYFTENRKILLWSAVEVSFDPRPGGKIRQAITEEWIMVGETLEVDPPHRLVYSWGWEGDPVMPPGSSRVEVTFTAIPEGTRLRVVHSAIPVEQVPSHERGWDDHLPLLVDAAGGDPEK